MKKVKKLTYKLIEPGTKAGKKIYKLLNELVVEHHDDHLREARIALAWSLTWKPDVDGCVTLGKCRKLSQLDRELIASDFVIILNTEWWYHEDVDDAQRAALLDHELCHGALVLDADDEPVEDERGRKMYRIRKHDIAEFSEIVERHGLYKRDLEKFAQALMRSKQRSLFENVKIEGPALDPGEGNGTAAAEDA